MSNFKNYLRAEILTSLFEKAFLSGKHSKAVAVTAFASLGTFWVVKKTFGGIFSLVFAPWNTKADKTYRLLKRVANEVKTSGKDIDSLQKNTDWMNEKWHSLSFRNTNGRNHITGILFFVHAKLGNLRIFVYSDSGEMLEFTWEYCHKFVGIRADCDLKIENLSDIYHKMRLNLL